MTGTTCIQKAHAILRSVEDKIARLQSFEPYLIDLSLRENPFGSRVGMTLDQKKEIFPQLRAFGFQNILLGTLDYAHPEELEVDDHFMMWLRDSGTDTTGGFAFTDIGLVSGGTFSPSISMQRMKDYRVPNTLHEIYLSPEGMKSMGYDFATLMNSLPATIAWLNDNVVGDHGGQPRIIVNIVDGCDAFSENLEQTCEVLSLLANQPIEGVSIEDDRGTYLPFQVGAFVAIAREYLPSPRKIVVHMHSGAGFENASLVEAILNGADGVWGGLPKRAAIIGHASLGELLANLVRVGNQNLGQYQIGNLLPFCQYLQGQDDTAAIPEDLPILGTNAYRLTLDFFRQTDRFMDLPPERIGGTYGYRVAPLGSDPIVLRGRLIEVTGWPPERFPDDVMVTMMKLMRRELIAGERIVYDDPPQLVALYERALGGGHVGSAR